MKPSIFHPQVALARTSLLAAAAMLLLPPAPAQSGGQEPVDDRVTYNPDPKDCCNCIKMSVAGVSDVKRDLVGKLFPSKDGHYVANVTLRYDPQDKCLDPVNATVEATPFYKGSRVGNPQQKSVTLSGVSQKTIEFVLELADGRQADQWEFILKCPYGSGGDESQSDLPFLQFEASKPNCQRIRVPLGSDCQSCQDGSCSVSASSDSFSLTIPTTLSNGGDSGGEIRFYAPKFENPGRQGIIVNVSPDFTVNLDANNLVTSIETGAGTVEVAQAAPALLALDPEAFVVTHRNPSGVVFRTTTISLVNEGGIDRFRSDSLFDGTITRQEQTQPQANSLVMEKGHVVSGTFEPLWRETYVKTEPQPGIEVQRRTIEERATAGATWAITSDVETTWEQQIDGWVKTREIIDPDGDALTSTWEYYQPGEITGPGGSTEGLGRLKQYIGHDGSQEFHTYELHKSSVTTPYAGNPAGRTATTTWNPGMRTLTLETIVGGNTVSKTVTTFTDDSQVVSVSTSVTAPPLVTTTHFIPSTSANPQDFGGRPQRTLHPDGTLTTYAYVRDATTGGYTVTMDKGSTGDGTTVSEGISTITETNSRGTVIVEMTEAIGFGPADDTIYEVMAVTAVDSLGRPVTTKWHPDPATVQVLGEQASASGEAWRTSVSYSCCGIASETDQYGITTRHAYDSLRRRIKTNRIGVTTETVHNGLTTETHRYSEAVSGSLSLTLVDNDDNLIGKVTRNLAGTSMTSSSPDPTNSQWQDPTVPEPGKLVDTTTTTTYQPAAGLSKRVVVTTPDNFSQTTDHYLDGRTYQTTGDLSPAMENAYSVNTIGELTTRGYIVGTGHNEVTGTQTDWAGRTLESGHLSSLASSVFQSSVSTEYNGLGQMVKSVDPDEVTTLMGYNARGERVITATDLNGNGTLDYGTDSVSFSETVPALDANSSPVWQTVTKVWQDGQTSAAGGTVVSTSLRSPDGLTSSSQSVGVSNPTSSAVSLNTPAVGSWTVLTTHPDGTDTLQTYTVGLLTSSASRDSADATIESVSYGYDNLNRQTTATHSRTGTTTTAYLTATADVVASVTDAGSRVTAFTYDLRGRRTEVDAPDTAIAGGTSDNITTTIYNPDSTIQETTGDQTYRVTYTYDYADRMKTMTTYGTSTATTTWIYNPTRGFMTRKEYQGGKGTDYTYTAAGRLATRTWARGVVTSYCYDDAGRLTSTDYWSGSALYQAYLAAVAARAAVFADPQSTQQDKDDAEQAVADAATAGALASTPNLTYTYDALNRQTTVTRGGVLHASYAYDPADLVLAAERQQIDTLNRTIERRYDAFLRPTGYTAGTPDGTAPFIVDTVEATATWTRDTAGRLATVTDGSDTFTYGYRYDTVAGNHRGVAAGGSQSTMPFTLDGPEIDTALEYDTTRNALLGRTNTYPGGSGTLSDFAYSVNALGQRDGLTTTGDAFTTALDWEWTYNNRGELVQADDQSAAANDRAYEFDGIGNRKKTVDGLLGDLPTTDNWAANNLNQYTTVDGYTPAPVHDDDGNLTSGPLPAAPGSTSTLVWDGENILISATVGTTTTTYTYDHLSRLTSATTGGTTVRYLYDGWNRIAEYNGTTQIAAYLWGLDLSGTPQGAGGVGGLLAISAIANGSVSDTFYPAYDGNGNVSEYVNAAGAEVAHFEYDPFGNLTVDDQGNAASFPYRFSTKPQDGVTGLYYYGYRFYDPVTGRWPSRDPIEERGGVNLYGFVGNDGVNQWDLLGKKAQRWEHDPASFPVHVGIAGKVDGEHADGVTIGSPAFNARITVRIFEWQEYLKIAGKLNLTARRVESPARGIEWTVAHERDHVAIWKEEWNKFVDDVNSDEGWWCVPCGQKLRDLANAKYELFLAVVEDRNLRYDLAIYDSQRNRQNWMRALGKRMNAQQKVNDASNDAMECFNDKMQ